MTLFNGLTLKPLKTARLQKLNKLFLMKLLKMHAKPINFVLLLFCLILLIVNLNAETVTLRYLKSVQRSSKRMRGGNLNFFFSKLDFWK